MNSPTQGSFAVLLCTVIGVSLLACQPQGSPDDLNNVVDGKRQLKVYHELRNATKKASSETFALFEGQGEDIVDPAAIRRMHDSLRVAYWKEVCDTNSVAVAYGDSIWTKGVKQKWSSHLH